MKHKLYIFLIFLTLFGCWELYSRHSDVMQFLLPAPSKIFLSSWERFDRLTFHATMTLKEMAGGFFLAFTIAFPLARMMSLWTTARLVLQPIFIVIQCIPMFALAPIMVFWFHWAYLAIVIPTALMIFFPLTMSIYQGLRSTPTHLIDYFRINGATSWQIFCKLQLPWAVPHLFSGIRISAAIAGIGAVAGEWAGAQAGLGLLMLESRRGADLEMTFAALFFLTSISLTLYFLTIFFERNLMQRFCRHSLARE